jgi:hypothetical protein
VYYKYVGENRSGNQEWTIQRHWQHWANKKPTKNSKKKSNKTTQKQQQRNKNKTKQNKQIHATP